ncbi:MAG: sugar phosphate isomerase/epimerase [archaeon]|nr:sugar phosphate isomerase/epimerase [archaeon]
MKIGASTLAIANEKFGENLGFYEDLDLKYIEIIDQYPNIDDNADLLNSFNFKYTVHSPIVDINIASLNEAIRQTSINEIKKSMDLATKINADLVVVHPGNVPFMGRGLEDVIYEIGKKSIIELGEYGQEIGVTPAVENMPDFEGAMHKDINVLSELLESIDTAMTLDVGHANTLGYTPDEMYSSAIKHIHMSNNYGDDDSHLALNEGSIDFKEVFDIFESKKYNGIYMLELTSNDSIEKSLEYIKNL